MNIITSYLDYINDNPNGYWFKRKIYGWGWTPARWQGWALTIAYAGLIVGTMILRADAFERAEGLPTEFWFLVALTVLFIVIVWRTGEPPKWQWGIPKNSKSKN